MTSISIVNYFTTNGDVSDEALNVYIKKLLLTNCCTLEIIQKYLQCHNCTLENTYQRKAVLSTLLMISGKWFGRN
ncbi:hypothetical protein T07_8048 [Trichinella nelsoni]|uniref:Uncharacterized protein n=1 Tax=Trichinella nelsoni TaxID=6336 RepID=A0A0V0RSB9_9BILA|nr:hypothetical protein T07_8048 [Trichinella nelsoni]